MWPTMGDEEIERVAERRAQLRSAGPGGLSHERPRRAEPLQRGPRPPVRCRGRRADGGDRRDRGAAAAAASPRSRGWLIRRALVAADVIGLTAAFIIALFVLGRHGQLRSTTEILLLLGTLPVWVTAGKLAGLYDQDEERTEHSTVDELAGVLNLVTLGVWTFYAATWVDRRHDAERGAHGAVLGALDRARHRRARRSPASLCRKTAAYQQNTLIVGAGDVGQLIGRKLKQHPEYGINLVGFVDNAPEGAPRRARRHHDPRSARPAARDHPRLRDRARADRVLQRHARRDAAADPRGPRPRRADRPRAAPVRDRRARAWACTRSRACR